MPHSLKMLLPRHWLGWAHPRKLPYMDLSIPLLKWKCATLFDNSIGTVPTLYQYNLSESSQPPWEGLLL